MGIFSKLFSGASDDDPLAALLAEASRSPARRAAFYRALADGTLWVPGGMTNGELLVRPYQVHGRSVLLVFTSRSAATALRDRPEMIELPMRSVCGMAPMFDGVILNYGTRTEKEFTAPELRGLLDGSIFELVEAEQGLLIGQPKEFPVRLMNELKRAFPSRPEITAAYIAQVTEEGRSGAPTIVIGIEAGISDEAFEEMRPKLERISEAAGASGVTFMKLADDPIAQYMRTETKAFYEGSSLA